MYLIFGQILQLAREMKDSGMTDEEIKGLPVYIGNDQELNGIHTAGYRDMIDPDDPDCRSIVELINEDTTNCIKLEGRAILIS